MSLWKVSIDSKPRLAVGSANTGPTHLLDGSLDIDSLLDAESEFLTYRSTASERIHEHTLLAPLGSQEVWASGVTFEVSRYAREQESKRLDVYREVYFADRPELFLKATAGTAVAPDGLVGIRSDSGWDVPEPEVGLVANARGEIVALTLGNDVSSRSIEGANPLYLPQAKIYDQSCSIGPCLVPLDEVGPLASLNISMTVRRDGTKVFRGESSMSRLRRKGEEMIDWLFRARSFPAGVVLLTGTGIVPPESFSLEEGDEVSICAPGLGILNNRVSVVGRVSSQ